MNNLREIMTERIVRNSWLDYEYMHRIRGQVLDHAESIANYRTWLNALDDENFLDAYNRVTDANNHYYDGLA